MEATRFEATMGWLLKTTGRFQLACGFLNRTSWSDFSLPIAGMHEGRPRQAKSPVAERWRPQFFVALAVSKRF